MGVREAPTHALACKVGGHINGCHDALATDWSSLCCKATTTQSIHHKPTIPHATNADGQGSADKDLQGDIRVHGFWKKGTWTICDVCITNTDQKEKKPENVLGAQEHEKKSKASV